MISLFFKRREAASLKTSAARLTELSKSSEEEVRFEVAHNPNAPIEVLFDLGKEFPSRVLLNPIIPLLLLEDPNFFMTAPQQTLLAFLGAHEVTQDVIDAVVNHTNKQTRVFFARHQKTPEHILLRLAKDAEPEVREGVLSGERAPLHVLLFMLDDENTYLGNVAASALRNRFPDVWKLVERLQEWPSATNRLSEQELSRLVAGGVGLLQKIASYPWLSESILRALASSKEEELRFSVVMHPQTSMALLRELSQDPIKQISVYASRRIKQAGL
jgi:hypothetical protein